MRITNHTEHFPAKILRTALISRRKFCVKSQNTAENEMNYQFLELLLNDEVHSLTFNGLPKRIYRGRSQDAGRMIHTLSSVANECPHLQKLICKDESCSQYFMLENLNIYMGRLVSCSLRFCGLLQLEIDQMVCTTDCIGRLAHHLPQLR
jgi:hypothetical protein